MELKEIRLKMKITQKEMAKKLDVPYSTYCKYEKKYTPTPEVIYEKAVEAFGQFRIEQNNSEWDEEFSRIQNNLIFNLREKGTDTPVFMDLIYRYMEMWLTVRKLEKDVRNRGVSTLTPNGYKKNESVALLVNVNKQMLIILDKLNLNASQNKPVGGIDV